VNQWDFEEKVHHPRHGPRLVVLRLRQWCFHHGQQSSADTAVTCEFLCEHAFCFNNDLRKKNNNYRGRRKHHDFLQMEATPVCCDSKTGNKHAVETNMLQHRDLVVPHALARFNLRFAMLCERTGEKCRQQHGNEKETTWQRSKIVLEPLQYNWYPTEVLLKLIQTISCPSL